MLSKSGFGMCVYLYFIPNKICIGLISSEHVQTSFFPIENSVWYRGNQNHVIMAGAASLDLAGRILLFLVPTDAFFPMPSFPVVVVPKEDPPKHPKIPKSSVQLSSA